MTTTKNKYKYVCVLQGMYGCGWEDIIEADKSDSQELRELRENLRDYRENEPQYPHRIITRRVLNTHDYYFGNCDSSKICVPVEAVQDIGVGGSNDNAVAHWVSKVDFSKAQPQDIKSYLDETGLEVAEDTDTQQRYLLWIACHDIAEGKQ